MGGIGKYFKEICLLQQPFVKDDKVSVEEHIAAVAKQVGASIKLVNYTRFEKGEGIEKRQDDLAEEVAKLIKYISLPFCIPLLRTGPRDISACVILFVGDQR